MNDDKYMEYFRSLSDEEKENLYFKMMKANLNRPDYANLKVQPTLKENSQVIISSNSNCLKNFSDIPIKRGKK